jgi:hypothetical protein
LSLVSAALIAACTNLVLGGITNETLLAGEGDIRRAVESENIVRKGVQNFARRPASYVVRFP